MIYLEHSTAKRDETAKVALETLKDNLLVLNGLTGDYKKLKIEEQNDCNYVGRLLSAAFVAIEKLLLLNIYCRNPVLLLPEKKIKITYLMDDFDYKRFDKDWLYSEGPNLIDVDAMWKICCEIDELEENVELGEYHPDFSYLKVIRNKYMHSFIDHFEPKSIYLIRFNVWLLIIKLIDFLPDALGLESEKLLKEIGFPEEQFGFLSEIGADDTNKSILDGFSEDLKAIQCMNLDEKREYFLKQLRTEEELNRNIPQFAPDGEPELDVGEGGKEYQVTKKLSEILKDSELNCSCPICYEIHGINDSGWLSVDCDDVTYPEDKEGDTMSWHRPYDISVSLDYFYCTNCAVHSDDRYLLEKLGYSEIFDLEFDFDWGINSGVDKIFIGNGGSYFTTTY